MTERELNVIAKLDAITNDDEIEPLIRSLLHPDVDAALERALRRLGIAQPEVWVPQDQPERAS